MKMYGDVEPLKGPRRFGERQVYNTLKDCFPDDREWLAFYSAQIRQLSRRCGDAAPLREVDFLVCHRLRGFLLIEVKGGEVRYQDGQWESGYQGEWSPMPHGGPMIQALGALKAYLQRVTVSTKGQVQPNDFLHDALLAFPAIDRLPNLPIGLAPEVIAYRRTCTSVDAMQRWLSDAFNRLGARHGDHSRREAVKTVLDRVVLPDITSEVGIRTAADRLEGEDAESVVRPSALADFVSERLERTRVLVKGAAGSGKTLVGVIRIARLLESIPGSRALYLTFNTRIAAHTRELLAQHFGDRVTACGYHELCEELVNRAGLDWTVPPANDAGAVDSFFKNNAPELLEQAVNKLGERRPIYDLLVVDEAQDFHELYIVSLEQLLHPKAVRWALYDPQQFIFQNIAVDAPLGAPRVQMMESQLRNQFAEPDRLLRCYRMSRQIYRYLRERDLLGPETECADLVYEGEAPTEVKVTRAECADAIRQALLHLIDELQVTPQRIVIQGVHRHDNDRAPIASALGPFADGRYRVASIAEPIGRAPDTVPYTTISAFKGCEQVACIVIVTNHLREPRGRELLCTAMTRARLHLHMIEIVDA